MFRTEHSVGMLKSIAMIAGLAIILWSLGLPSLRLLQAASITGVSDVLSDSAPSAASNHTITFTTPSGIAASETVTITFPSGFDISSLAVGDFDLSVAAADQTLAASASATDWGVATSGQTITLTAPSSGTPAAANDELIIKIGTNATGGTNQITNPSAEGSYEISIGGTMTDSGATRVVILTAVTVSASVATIFNFTVSGTPAGTKINNQTTTGATGSTTIPFGSLTALTATTSAQLLTVSTNAANGYSVTVQVDGALRSSTGEDIKEFSQDSDTNTPTTWAAPTGLINSPTTWGHWGVTSDDTSITSRAGNEFGDNLFIAASTTPREVMQHTGPVNGTGVGVGTTTVGYRVEISALQAAGDYSTTLTYVATPTF